ncbi:MAG: right-handed parallel beta-helix repeat-containing protein, partial [Oscillospiraceae bacterium]
NGIITLCLKEEGQKFSKMSKVGNGLILRHHLRTHPCFYVTYCRDVKFKNIDVYHTLGMAFIAQHTREIELDRFNVKINPSNPRIFTATADATHFVYCGGEIKINDCLFENQLDDPINVHGIYARIEKVIDEKTIMVQLVHHQQKGVAIGEIGEELQVVDNLTMLSIHKTKIENICTLNKDYILINLSCPCGEMKTGYVVENLAYVPNVTVTNCVFRNNRARGPLLTAGGKILLEKNYFSVAGAAVLIEGDSNLWFESGATKDISILNNVFDNCAYIPDWGQAPIQVTPSTVKASGNERFHKKLVVKNNVFNCFDGRLLYAKHIENIEFTDNKITKTDKFPPVGNERFHLEEVVSFTEKNNG